MDVEFVNITDWNGVIEEDKGPVAFRWNDGVLEVCNHILSHSVVSIDRQRLDQTEVIYRWSAVPNKGDPSLAAFE
jgi:hypothetical protein